MKGNLVRGGGGEGKNGVKSLFFLLFCLIFFARALSFVSLSLLFLSKTPRDEKVITLHADLFPFSKETKRQLQHKHAKKKRTLLFHPSLSSRSLS